jgi:hypothetical protein
MPAWFARHPYPPNKFGNAILRCDICYDRKGRRKFGNGSFVIMEPADSFSSSVDIPWALTLPLDKDDAPYYLDDDSSFLLDPEPLDDSSFILDPETLDNSAGACKVPELVSTSTTLAGSEVSSLQLLLQQS